LNYLVKLCPLILALGLVAQGVTVNAQLERIEHIAVLPLVVEKGDAEFGLQLYEGMIEGLRLLPNHRLVELSRVIQLLNGKSTSEILRSTADLARFAGSGDFEFIIGGVVRHLENNRLEVTAIIYSRSDQQVREFLHTTFDSEAEALAGAREIGQAISHPKNFTPKDTPLLFSLIIPGMGQLQMGEPTHAVLSAGLVFGSILYGLSIPSPDPYQINFGDYNAQLIPGTGDYLYFIRYREVSAEEYFQTLESDIDHSLRADRERKSADKRKAWAARFLFVSYVFNLLDTLYLIRQEVDARPFFVRLEAIPDPAYLDQQPGLRLQFRWIIK
jgi:hypothetical protein